MDTPNQNPNHDCNFKVLPSAPLAATARLLPKAEDVASVRTFRAFRIQHIQLIVILELNLLEANRRMGQARCTSNVLRGSQNITKL